MRHSSIWRGSLLVMHKVAQLQGGLFLCLWERGSRRRTRAMMRLGLCWPDSSETSRHCSPPAHLLSGTTCAVVAWKVSP